MLIGARLNWCSRHGKGKTWGSAPKKFIQIDIEPKEMDSSRDRRPVVGEYRLVVSRAALRHGRQVDRRRRPTGWRDCQQTRGERGEDGATLMNNNSPMDYHGAPASCAPSVKERPDAILVNEGANTLDLARGIIDVYQPRKRIDVGTWGIMGIGMG